MGEKLHRENGLTLLYVPVGDVAPVLLNDGVSDGQV